MKDLIINAVINFFGVLCISALGCLIAFISFNSLVSAAPMAVKSLAVWMLIVALVILLVAYCIFRYSFDSWTEDLKNYKKRND